MIDESGHITEGWHCWCEPLILRPCPERCSKDSACWRCGGSGDVPVTADQAAAFDGQLVIVHREET